MKKIIITGATSGIGLETAKYLIQQGYFVIITGRNKYSLSQAVSYLGDACHGYICDSEDLTSISKFGKQISQDHPIIDGIFLNAGIFEALHFTDITPEQFDTTMNINFKGAFFTIQALIRSLNNPSSIVLNTSIVTRKGFPTTSVYSASKSALESISKVLNLELADTGIRINMVSPGVTRTPIQEKSGMSDEQIKALLENIKNSSPLGKIIEPKDIAPVVEFLLSEKSLSLRNQTIHVEGGSTL